MYGGVVSVETSKFQVGANGSSTSTILNSYIAQMLVLKIVDKYFYEIYCKIRKKCIIKYVKLKHALKGVFFCLKL